MTAHPTTRFGRECHAAVDAVSCPKCGVLKGQRCCALRPPFAVQVHANLHYSRLLAYRSLAARSS